LTALLIAAERRAGRPIAHFDAQIAAIARAAAAAIATRNVRDFEHCGVTLFNPCAESRTLWCSEDETMHAITRVTHAWFVIAVTAAACGGGGNGNGGGSGGSNAFPFSGPSCAGSQLPGMTTTSGNSACQSCVQNQCDVLQCITTDCAAYFSCACACPAGSLSCLQGCVAQETSACTDCIGAKIPQCVLATCGDACGLSSIDAGFAVQCSALASCCARMTQGTSQYSACQQTVSAQSDSACRQALAAYTDAGACP
jgi:hypothetical protein